MSNIEDILKATDDLTALSFINIQELLPHRNRLENALRILQEKVDATRAIQSKPAASNSSSASIVESSNLNEAPCPLNSSNSHHDADQGVQNVLSILSEEKVSKKLENYLSSPILDFTKSNELDWFEEDPRLVDIRLSSRPSPTSHVNLRRGLSQRSLAVEYDEWEKNNFQTSRVIELAQHPASSKSRQSHINQFVEANKHRFKDRNTALHGIKHGIRLLVFEKIYGCAGTSSVFFFIYGYFRSVKYEFYPDLAKSLKHTFWDQTSQQIGNSTKHIGAENVDEVAAPIYQIIIHRPHVHKDLKKKSPAMRVLGPTVGRD
ncbi:hypothetical protein N7481_003467 [Penicillium waksmanii]|uniref:uncharacterized protein n=1 Tax=Penicillium waksmanii TaxID=69791 RepID=UPI002546EDF2|nr:uncharacterized protein N7481_003467 [Penicillium waksmanii]KAJ5988257.1 hypothetical protein N7481_003467 [Penicillium waksmanii]